MPRRKLGNYAQAEKLLRGTGEIQRRVLGPEHGDTLRCMSDLANEFTLGRKYAEAERLYRETVGIQRRVLGPEAPRYTMVDGGPGEADR